MTRRSGAEALRWERHPWVRLAHSLNRFFARGMHHLDVLRPNQLPPSGPAILVCNHTSGLDPVLIQSTCRRLIVWMMAAEYYHSPALGWFYRMLRAIPVERTGRDLSATRQALRSLEAGHVLGVFPEGRIEPDRQLLPFQTGVALMAAKTKVPVFPAFLEGTQRGKSMLEAFLQPQDAQIAFGERIDLVLDHTPRIDLENATARIEQAVSALQNAYFRGGDWKKSQQKCA